MWHQVNHRLRWCRLRGAPVYQEGGKRAQHACQDAQRRLQNGSPGTLLCIFKHQCIHLCMSMRLWPLLVGLLLRFVLQSSCIRLLSLPTKRTRCTESTIAFSKLAGGSGRRECSIRLAHYSADASKWPVRTISLTTSGKMTRPPTILASPEQWQQQQRRRGEPVWYTSPPKPGALNCEHNINYYQFYFAKKLRVAYMMICLEIFLILMVCFLG